MTTPAGYLWGTYTLVGQGKQSTGDHIYAPIAVQNPDNGGDGPFIGYFYGETVGTYNPNGPDSITNNVVLLDNFLLPLLGPVTANTETVQKLPFRNGLQPTGSAGPGIGIVETQTGAASNLTHKLNLVYAGGASNGALTFTAPKVIESFTGDMEHSISVSFQTNSASHKIDTFAVAWDDYKVDTTHHTFSYDINFQIFHPTLSNTGAVTATTPTTAHPIDINIDPIGTALADPADSGSSLVTLPGWAFHAGAGAYLLELAEADQTHSGQMLVHFQGYKADGTTNSVVFDITPEFDASLTGTITNTITLERNPTTNDLVTSTLVFKQFSDNASNPDAYAVAWNEQVVANEGTYDQVEFVIAPHDGTSIDGPVVHDKFLIGDGDPDNATPQNVRLQITSDDHAILAYGDQTGTHLREYDSSGNLLATYNETADHTFENIVLVGAFPGDDRVAIVYDEPTTGNSTEIVSHVVDMRTHALTDSDLTNLTTSQSGINYIAGTSFNDSGTHAGDDVTGATFTGQGGNNTYYYVGQQGNPDGVPIVHYTGGGHSWNAVILSGSLSDYSGYTNNNGSGHIDGDGDVAGTMNFASTQELVFSPSQSALIDGTSSTIVASAGSHDIILTNFIDPGTNTQTYIDLARIMAGATLEIDTAWGNSPIAGTNNIVTFAGAGATLRLDDPANFHAKLAGLAVGNTIDVIDDVTSASINAVAKQLTVNTVSDGSFVYNLTSAPTGLISQLELKDDGHDGALLIVHGTAPVTWKTGVNGDFATAANWTPAIVPDQIDNAAITPAGTYTVTSSGDETVKTLVSAAGATLEIANNSSFTILNGAGSGAPAGKINIDAGSTLHLHSGPVNNSGTISVADHGTLVFDTDLTVQGGGSIVLGGSQAFIQDDGSLPNTKLTLGIATSAETISGVGNVGGGLTVLNIGAKGVINANDSTGGTLTVGAGDWTNLGTLEASKGGTLVIAPGVDPTNSGLIEALGGTAATPVHSTVMIQEGIDNVGAGSLLASGNGAIIDLGVHPGNVTVTGGTFKTASGGFIQTTDDVTISGVTNTGDLRVGDSTTLHIQGAVFNNTTTGVLSVRGDSANTTSLVIDNDVILQGGGKVDLAGALGTASITATGHKLTNADNTISGGGAIGNGAGGLSLTNGVKGVINATDGSNSLGINVDGAILNQGTLESTTGTLFIESGINNNTTKSLIQALGPGAHVNLQNSNINNTTGTILASGTGAHVDLTGATVTGGTFKTAANGAIHATANSTITDVTNTGSLTVSGVTGLHVASNLGTPAFNNSGTVTVDASSSEADLVFDNNITLQGGGKIVLSTGVGSAEIQGAVTITNGTATSAHTISGSGDIGVNGMTLTNGTMGIVNGNDAAHELLLDHNLNVVNQGIMEGTAAGGLDVLVDVGNSKTIQALSTGTAAAVVHLQGKTITNTIAGSVLASGAKATLNLNTETIVGGKLSTVSGGTIDMIGTDTFDASVVGNVLAVSNAGLMKLENGATLQIKGTETFTGAGTFELKTATSLITADGAAAKFINSGNTIFGAGKFDDASLTVDNKSGLISVGLWNLFATNEAKIQDDVISNATVQQSATGSITATAGHQVTLDGAAGDTAVTNGTLTGAAATSIIEITNAVTLTGVKITNAGEMGIHDGTTTSTGTLANTGFVSIENETVTISGAVTNTGTGAVSIGMGVNGLIDVSNNSTVLFSGAVSGTGTVKIEDTSTVEFSNTATTQNVAFEAGATSTLQLDHSHTFIGKVSGFAPAPSMGDFSGFTAFGDSSIDSGWFPTAIATGGTNSTNPDATGSFVKNTLISNAVAAGGQGDPVGLGLMNSEILAKDFGYTAVPADTAGGGNNYAIAGAITIADAGGTHQTTPANGDTVDPGNGSIGNVNKNGALPSTVQQIENYLSANGGSADPDALYLIGTGGNDTTFANDDMTGDTKAQKQAYLMHQAKALADEIEHLQTEGAQTIVVHSLSGDDPTANNGTGNFATLFDSTLFSALNTDGVLYIKSDLAAMKNAVTAHPTTFGLTAGTVAVGTPASTMTSSAFIDFDSINNKSNVPTPIQTGWGQWGAPTGIHSNSYAWLRTPNAEYTSLYSDDQHFSTQGQQIEANYDLGLLFVAGQAAMDSIDFKDIGYTYGTTTASYSGNTTGGTLTVTDGANVTKLTLTGDYTTTDFITVSDGNGHTDVIEAATASTAADVSMSHLLETHYKGAFAAGMTFAQLNYVENASVTLSADGLNGVLLDTAESIVTNGKAQTLTNSELIHGGGAIGDGFMALVNSALGTINADDPDQGILIQSKSFSNAGLIETTGGWLDIQTAVTGAGAAKISGGGLLEFGAASSSNVTFVDHTGILMIDNGATAASKFNGTISGFSGGAEIDFGDINFTSGQQVTAATPSGANTVVTITDGTHNEALTFVGAYGADNFQTSADVTGHLHLHFVLPI